MHSKGDFIAAVLAEAMILEACKFSRMCGYMADDDFRSFVSIARHDRRINREHDVSRRYTELDAALRFLQRQTYTVVRNMSFMDVRDADRIRSYPDVVTVYEDSNGSKGFESFFFPEMYTRALLACSVSTAAAIMPFDKELADRLHNMYLSAVMRQAFSTRYGVVMDAKYHLPHIEEFAWHVRVITGNQPWLDDHDARSGYYIGSLSYMTSNYVI